MAQSPSAMGGVMMVLACICPSWILAKTPTWPPSNPYGRATRAADTTHFIMSISYPGAFCFPTSLPMIPKQHPMPQMIWDRYCSSGKFHAPLLGHCEDPALTPTQSPRSFLRRRLIRASLKARPTVSCTTRPPLRVCEQPEAGVVFFPSGHPFQGI